MVTDHRFSRRHGCTGYPETFGMCTIENNFHSTLAAVGHERSAARRTKAGTEWFATTLEAVDALAKLMGLEIEKYESSEDWI